jgi:hypothetical protein
MPVELLLFDVFLQDSYLEEVLGLTCSGRPEKATSGQVRYKEGMFGILSQSIQVFINSLRRSRNWRA